MNSEMVSHDWADRLVYAHDASVYRMIPQAVARPKYLDDVRQLLMMARDQNFGLTFRTGGTSLSGQAVTHGMVVLLGKGWDSFRIEDNGLRLTCGPALRGAVANAALSRFSRRIGPDPASIQAACLGGIVANNASGMCCGVEENSYQTIVGMKILLASGTLLDTRKTDCDEEFRAREPQLYAGLLRMRDELRSSQRLVELIRKKSAIKNTTGYGLQAFLDFTRPVDILTHVMVGSEGTLGFIADLTLRTVPLRPHRASALLSFEELGAACEVTPWLRDLGFSAIELLDHASVQAIRDYPQLPAFLRDMPRQGACLLVQAQEDEVESLQRVLEQAQQMRNWKQIVHCTEFFADNQKQAQLWDLRKGIFPAVGARRARGTSVIIEDVAFPLADLADGTRALRTLLERHDYSDAVIYGHARDGNLHFVLAQNFDSSSEVNRYERFIGELVECVAGRFDGSLKAEHGTGRNMAPFVEKEWGTEAYALMRRLKRIFDPDNILNPGVLINTNPRAHLENLKVSPVVDEEIDACIECGFCEPVCPSQGLTLSPRGRIVLQREMSAQPNHVQIDDQNVDYAQQKTCAADGLCAKACPVGINTGRWVKKVRSQQSSPSRRRFSRWTAEQMSTIEKAAQVALGVAELTQKWVGPHALESATRLMNSGLGLPVWSRKMLSKPPESKAQVSVSKPNVDFVVMRSCVTRVLNDLSEDPLLVCAQRAGVKIQCVSERGLCCGQPWSSKGLVEDSRLKLSEFIERCFELSQAGRVPIVVDNSPCAYALVEDSEQLSESAASKLSMLKILDPVDFADVLTERLPLSPVEEPLRFFPVCSVVKSGRLGKFEDLARKLSQKPILPLQASCCGMAGDRGLWLPELSTHAVERIPWSEGQARQGVCSSRTCEVALSGAGVDFNSIFAALELASRPRE